MKLYAICWQDTSEPWGWAPATKEVVGDDEAPAQVFFWHREEAEQTLVGVISKAAQEHLRAKVYPHHKITAEQAYEWAKSEWSVQEYEVPTPHAAALELLADETNYVEVELPPEDRRPLMHGHFQPWEIAAAALGDAQP